MTRTGDDCKGCRASVRISDAEVRRILDDYLRDHPQAVVCDDEAERRMAVCAGCGDLQYGTTCRHCGCLVAVRVRLKDTQCPRPDEPKW